ncbi:MAG: hypothetical protein B6I36_10680 [Desulfobacteraceae bacterium 4572_35.1]|nr:MAG: hypothetical protein B6I36_10680 [Desulfobacteraceae bacterium 4572_35.1]
MKTILIADDEKPFLLSLIDGLEANNDEYEIVTADNGREAVEILRSMPIDLLVTDLKMPEMNGFEILAWTSRHQPQLPVIVMSAFGTPEIEAQLEKMDTLQFLDKPLDLQKLQEGISNGLNAGGKSFIRGITLATFLQLMKVEKKNCTLKVINTDYDAYLYVRQGELIDAELNDISGIDAAMEIVTWSDSEIEMDGVCRRQEDVINLSLEHLLIEAFRLKDEAEEIERSDDQEINPNDEDDDQNNNDAEDGATDKITIPKGANENLTLDDSDESILQLLAKTLTKLASVQEYVIFDENKLQIEKNIGKCSLTGMDLAKFDKLLSALTEDLQNGACRFITFNGKGRNRYIILYIQQYSVLAKLKPGARAQQVGAEIEKHIDY